jgi:hypothetical protein
VEAIMALLDIQETASNKASVTELAAVFEKSSAPMTIPDALMQLKVFDPGRQRSLTAAFLRECQNGRKYAHLVGTKVRPSTTARGRISSVLSNVDPLDPKTSLIKRSDAFRGLRSVDKANYSEDLRVVAEQVTDLNLTGKAGVAVNRMALEYDHALELAQVKLENAMTLAEERRKWAEQLAEVLNRVVDGADGEGNGRRVRVRPTTKEAAE